MPPVSIEPNVSSEIGQIELRLDALQFDSIRERSERVCFRYPYVVAVQLLVKMATRIAIFWKGHT